MLARIPKAARAETPAGAEAFAAFFFASLNRAATAGNPTALLGLSSEDCKTCLAIITSIGALQAKGRHHNGDTVTVSRTEVISRADRHAVVRIPVVQNAIEIVDRSGRVVDRTEGDSGAFVATLAFDGKHWVITKLQAMSS